MKENKSLRYFLTWFVIPSIPTITLLALKPQIASQIPNPVLLFLVLFAAAFLIYICCSFASATVTKMTGGKTQIQWSKKLMLAIIMALIFAAGLCFFLMNVINENRPIRLAIGGRYYIDEMVLLINILIVLGMNLVAILLTELTFRK